MAEYYAVLSKAVAGLEANSADTRRAVYDKARNALIGQLKAIDPPLPTAEISRQRLELEEAIRRVERETSSSPAGVPAQRAPARPVAEQAPRQTPQDVFRRAIQEAERENPDPQRSDRSPAVARVADDWSSERTDRAPPARPTQQYLPSQGYVEEEPRSDEPRLAPDYDYEWDPNAKPATADRGEAPYVDARDRQQPKRDKRGKNSRAALGPRSDDDPQMVERKARPSRLPTILLIVLIIAMVGGLGALGWSQRAVITDLLRPFDSGAPATSVATTEPAAVDAGAKDTDRLLPGQAAPAGDVRVVAPDGSVTEPAATGAQATGTGVLPDASTTNQNTSDTDALVAQRAVLYEEPLDSAAAASGVVAINAAVTWSFVQGTDGAEVVGNIDVPERAMKLKITLRRNVDETLPASHLVEVVIGTPANFPGKGIKDVPRLVLKPSEEARGQPLIGASAKVADGFFWIGLSSEAADLTNNLKLLKERTWIDLPLVYETGQRAILTFEKGTPGERVLDRALTAWAG
jgi:hypothetical protein